MTLGAWLRMAAARLEHEKIPSAPLEAQLLAARTLGKDRSFILTHPELPINESDLEPLLERRANMEPLAYILGTREFFGRAFDVDPRVLIPRQETELLVEIALFRFPPDAPLRVLDIGTGSGAIAITIALERPAWTVTATDCSTDALDVASANARRLEASVQLVHANLFPSETPNQQFDLILSNPPYIAIGDPIGPDVAYEPKQALFAGYDGMDVFRSIAAQAGHHLRPKGELWLEIGFGQSQTVTDLFEQNKWLKLGAERDLAGIIRTLGFSRAMSE